MKGTKSGCSALETAATALEAVSIGGIAVLAGLVFLQILLRNLFSLAFAWMDELTRYLQVSMVFFMVPILARRGQHLVVDSVVNILPRKLRRIFNFLSLVLTAVFAASFLVSGYGLMLKAGTVKTPAMGIPNIIFFMPAFIGMALLFLISAERLVNYRGGKE